MKRVFYTAADVEDRKQHGLIATQNFSAYSPYIVVDGQVTIDSAWWADQPARIRENILRVVPCPSFRVIESPHDVKKNAKMAQIYNAYNQGYDYECWYSPSIRNGPQDVTLLTLSTDEKQVLFDITSQRLDSTDKIRPYVDDKRLLLLRQRLAAVMSFGGEYYLRLSGTSSKKDRPLAPIKTAHRACDVLTSSFSFLSQEYCHPQKATSIIVMPWNHAIKPRCEFRVFIHNQRVTGIAPQRWYNAYIYTEEEIDIIEQSILRSEFWLDVPYKSLVADVYIDFTERQAYLIECNPFGIFGPSGSSLFSWKEDYDILYGTSQPDRPMAADPGGISEIRLRY